MCQKCVDLINELLPNIKKEDLSYFLWNATAFPMADCDTLQAQIKEMVERSNGDVYKAVLLANEDIDQALKKYKEEQISKKQNKE